MLAPFDLDWMVDQTTHASSHDQWLMVRSNGVKQQLDDVRRRIQRACQRSGRSPSSVTLVAVTKTVGIETIREAMALGVRDLGENRVQEALQKQSALGSGFWVGAGPLLQGGALQTRAGDAVGTGPGPRAQPAPALVRGGPGSPERVRWHLVGHLQRNKAKPAVGLFDVVHSVDSPQLIESLDEQAGVRRRTGPLDCLIQVNVAGEATKHGCPPEELERLVAAMRRARYLTLVGLMTMAPWSEDPEQVRPYFRRLRQLRDHVDPHLKLSMGMSGDFEVAIEEGADYIRVGTAIFGAGGQG